MSRSVSRFANELTRLYPSLGNGFSCQGLPEIEPIPDAWKQAGAEIAKEAAAGKLYTATEAGVLSKAVDADGVSVSKTFSATAKNLSAGEVFALALIKPWLTKRSGVMMLKRV